MTPKKLDWIYRNTRTMPIASICGLLIPLIFLIVLPLSWITLLGRRKCLSFTTNDPSLIKKREYIAAKGWYLWVPTAIVVVLILLGFSLWLKFQ